MNPTLERSLVRDLETIVGETGLVTGSDRLLAYESDGLTAYRSAPAAVVLPRSTDEARRVVARLHGAGVAVVPRGAGTGLSGGALAGGESVVIGTARMNRILGLDARNRVARVQPGLVNARLSEAARPHGLYYAPDPSSQSACTLGGNVAENSGGPHCLKYGVTSRYVTAVTLVLPDGEVCEPGRSGSGGLDLLGVVVGSEGCFGLVTEIEVRLLPLPEGVRTLLAVFDQLEDAGRAVTDIIARGLLPAAVEIIDRETIRAVEASVFAAGYPVGAGAALVVEFDGTSAGLDEETEAAEACCRAAGASEVRRARDELERASLWKGRKKAFGAMGRIAPDLMVQDATVPRTRLPEVLGRIGEIGRRHGLVVANVFHAGDGNLHPNILFDRRNPDEVERVERASREVMEACVGVGGTITGEHGVGIDKRRYMTLVHGAAELEAMADVKDVFDAAGRFNPGKVLPDGVAARPRPTPFLPGEREGRAGRADRGEVAARLESLLGSEVVGDGSEEGCQVVRPRSQAEVAAVLELAGAEGWRVLPVGGGVHPSLGADLRRADLALHTSGLDAIVEYEPADLTLTAGAGITLATLQEVTGAHGQWLPLDPPGTDAATLGGALATGLGGALASAYGQPRDLVLGLTVVTGDGRALRLGGRVVKNVAGFDLVKLVVGSRGALGVVTSVTVRLFPVPSHERVLVARAARLEELIEVVRTVATAPLLPASLEAGEPDGPGKGAVVVVRLAGGAATVAADERLIRARAPALSSAGPEEGRSVLEALRQVDHAVELAGRVLFPPAGLRDVVRGFRETLGAPGGGGEVRLAVHGDQGVLRWAVGSPGYDVLGWADAIEALRSRLADSGGDVRMTAVPNGWPNGLARPMADHVTARLERELEARFDACGTLPSVRMDASSPAWPEVPA